MQMKIAIIELGNSHDECLYSQIKIIKSVPNIHLTLITNPSLKESITYFSQIDKNVYVSIRKNYKQWIDLYKIWRLCRAEKFHKIIFNTAQGKLVCKLISFPFYKHTQFYGILHNTKKLNVSGTQKLISKKIAHYFILSDYLYNKINQKCSISVFYPIFFPPYPNVDIEKNKEDIWICVPGQVELKRRDYTTLFDSIEKYGIKNNIKILLLGRCAHSFGNGDFIKQKIKSLSITNAIYIWDTFIPVPVFYAMIKKSDYILPLIHKGTNSDQLYNTQISGAFNLAVGYQKPLLIESDLKSKFSEYNPIVYEKEQLMKTINQLDVIDSKSVYTDKRWSFNFQKTSYLNALGIECPKNQ